MVVDGKQVTMVLWDTAGQEEYDRLRPLSYESTDAFVLIFDRYSIDTYENIKSRWFPELQQHAGHVPIVLVGVTIESVDPTIPQLDLITSEQGKELKQTIKVTRLYIVVFFFNFIYTCLYKNAHLNVATNFVLTVFRLCHTWSAVSALVKAPKKCSKKPLVLLYAYRLQRKEECRLNRPLKCCRVRKQSVALFSSFNVFVLKPFCCHYCTSGERCTCCLAVTLSCSLSS